MRRLWRHLWEKSFSRSTAETNYTNFNVLRNNNRHNWRLNKSSKTFWIDGDLWVFLNWFSEQIFFKSSCFFLLFQNSHFFGGVIFSKQLLFQNENFTEQPLLENEKFFTAVTFRNSCFSPCLGQKYLKTTFSFYLKATFSRQVLLHSINFFRRATFWKKLIFQKSNIPHYLLFVESCFFREATFSKDGTFYNSYLFRRATFLQHTFSEELLFYSYASFPQLHFLFIC